MLKNPEHLIIGGGVIGLTTAYYLAQAGCTVAVLDMSGIGTEASWAGAGIIPPGRLDRAGNNYEKLRALSANLFADFSSELKERTGISNGYHKCGGIELFRTQDDARALWSEEGIEFEEVDECWLKKHKVPVCLSGAHAYHVPDMSQVRNPWHLRALHHICTQLGIGLLPFHPVSRLIKSGRRIIGVELRDGQMIEADNLMLTAGAWTNLLVQPLGVDFGIVPVRGQIVLLRTNRPILKQIILVGKSYLVPREDGHILVGSTEEPEAGFQKATTAQAVRNLIDFACTLVPELEKAEVIMNWAGIRPGSRDGLPTMGRVEPWENLFVAAGHFRAGIQLSPATGLVMSQLLRQEKTAVALDDFQPSRIPVPNFKPAFHS